MPPRRPLLSGVPLRNPSSRMRENTIRTARQGSHEWFRRQDRLFNNKGEDGCGGFAREGGIATLQRSRA